MPSLYMLIGVTGSGKSFWASRNVELLDAVVISSDNIIEEKCAEVGCNYTEGFSRFVKFASKEMDARLRKAVSENKNIIWDQTNVTVKTRGRKLKQFPSTYRKTAVFFDVENDVVDKRLKEREEATGKHIRNDVLWSMRNGIVSPNKDEGFDEIVVVKK